jgi:hypothetical protein
MRCQRYIRRTWRGVLSALLTLVIAVAPLAAQASMSATAHAAMHAVPNGGHSHTAGAAIAHSHADESDHTHHGDLPGPQHLQVQPAGHHQHGNDTADLCSTLPPVGHHDHADGAGAGCCGAFCHSAANLTAPPCIHVHTMRPTFTWLTGRLLVAVDPDQLQRPPSRLLSL